MNGFAWAAVIASAALGAFSFFFSCWQAKRVDDLQRDLQQLRNDTTASLDAAAKPSAPMREPWRDQVL